MTRTLTVTDPHYRGRVLAVHADLAAFEARELVAVYCALGYGAEHLTVQVGETKAAA
jgi:hypothetical protein